MISAKVFPFETAGVKGIKKEEVKEREREAGPRSNACLQESRIGWVGFRLFRFLLPILSGGGTSITRVVFVITRERAKDRRGKRHGKEKRRRTEACERCAHREGKFRGRKTRPTDSVRSRASARAFVERGYRVRFFFFCINAREIACL